MDRIPVVERIVQDVVATLQGVSITNGFNVDLDVERPMPRGTNWTGGKTVVYLGARVPTEDGDRPQQYDEWFQTVIVVYHGVETDLDKPVDAKLILATADIYQALCSTKESRRRDNWAITTIAGDVVPLERDADSNEATIMMEFTVQYRTAWGDPFTCPYRN